MRYVFFTIILATQSVFAQVPHLDLEMTSREYLKVLESHPQVQIPQDFDEILEFGKRNLQWLDHMNRFQENKLSFTSKETMQGSPPERPIMYNRELITQGYNQLISDLPPIMRDILMGQKDFTDHPPLETKEYLGWALKADRAYQFALRWMTLAPYLPHLSIRRANDIRGYYFISRDPEAEEKLREFDQLDEKMKSDYDGWLLGICINSERSSSVCRRKLNEAIKTQRLNAFYGRYRANAARIYSSFFTIPTGATYRGLQWSKNNPDITVAPFADPKNDVYREYLKDNLEDEWQWGNWKLVVDFSSVSDDPVRVHWRPGITPHVPGLGSPNIYMDSNALLTEWDVQWTIRHEFGHVLGLPDCYHEFYDTDQKVIIAYQLDITNLMCSRRGELQELHLKELRRAYF